MNIRTEVKDLILDMTRDGRNLHIVAFRGRHPMCNGVYRAVIPLCEETGPSHEGPYHVELRERGTYVQPERARVLYHQSGVNELIRHILKSYAA